MDTARMEEEIERVKITDRGRWYRHWQVFALLGLALLGLALRLYNVNWDGGNNFQPDERQILFHVMALSWPKSFAQFLDPVNSPLNPRFFAYGSFPLYLLAFVGNILSHFWPRVNDIANLTIVGRVISTIFDSGTILLTGWLGYMLAQGSALGRRYSWWLALLAAALTAFMPLQLQLSHFYVTDTPLLFFVTLTVLGCVALVNTEAPVRWLFVIGLGYGLALATKFSAAPLIVPLIVAAMLRWYKNDFFSGLLPFFIAVCTTAIVFLIAEPYVLLDLPNFMQQLSYQGDLARGLIDLPYVRQFAGTTPYLDEVQNIVLWGMGLLLGITVVLGVLWLLWRIWKRDAGLWLIVLSWVLVYGAITGDFYVKYMRYMLPLYPFLTLMAAALLVTWVSYWQERRQNHEGYRKRVMTALPLAAIGLVLAGTIFQGLALLNVYSQPNTRVQASSWIYSHINAGSVFTYEQWDDPLPVTVGDNNPFIYSQATYPDASGQAQTGLDLYGDDTTAKARQLANLLPTINVITMATDRLDKSIPRQPFRYPLTIHYYQLLFSGQLGFHLAAIFQNHPNLFGITLDDSSADESYSVFDHPTVKIFVRDNPYPYTANQLYQKLLTGVQLPPGGTGLSGAQRSLLLTPQQIADNQQSPPFGIQFPANSVANTLPILFWWLILLVLGLVAFPIAFPAFRKMRDRGYILSKTLGILLLAYFAWLLASLHILAFSSFSLILVLVGLLLVSLAMLFWQRQTFNQFLRQHWRLLLIEEGMFTLAFLLFVGIRSLNPDAWNIYIGGEKPMELAFLNAVLRSQYMPPLDPWFAGGYINYYYYGYVIFGSLIKATGIVPTTAFNFAMPTLFALTFAGVVSIIYSFTRRFSIALLGGYFAALIGNLDGLTQLKGQVTAVLAHMSWPAYNYWQSSRVIPFTINEFPYWSFLFADLHPHVIDLPIATLMLGLVAALILPEGERDVSVVEQRRGKVSWCLFAAFVFGTIACVNPWDMPVYAVILGVALLVQTIYQKRQEPRLELFVSLGFCLAGIAILCGGGYLLYWPFYASYEQLFVNGVGLVTQGTSLSDFLTVFGFWLFLALSFLLYELYRWWKARSAARGRNIAEPHEPHEARRIAGYLLLAGVVLAFLALLGLKTLLVALVGVGIFLFVVHVLSKTEYDATTRFAYLMVLMGLAITLGQEVVYVRDFLDGGDYFRMNTVFKFSMQAWLCFGVGGSLVIYKLLSGLNWWGRRAWTVALVVLMLGCSVFLVEGTGARIGDHQLWVVTQPPAQSANYTPTLDGFAFARAWYPGDAQAITWLNDNIAGSPVVLEAAAPASYQWYNRVSVYTGLPDVLGWPDHVGEQRYGSQIGNRAGDISTIYTTTDSSMALELLQYYHVSYIYVGQLEQQLYGAVGLAKFDQMVVGNSLRLVYHSEGVTIYQVV